MPPMVIDLRRSEDARDVVHRAVQALAEGRCVAFPTETDYVVAASGRSAEAAAALSCPVSLILGERDRMTAVRGAREFAKALPKASIEIIPGCGHGMMEEKPEQTHKALVKALVV